MTGINDAIVSMLHHDGKILVATKEAVFDITDAANPVPLTTIGLLQTAEMGYKYEVTATKA